MPTLRLIRRTLAVGTAVALASAGLTVLAPAATAEVTLTLTPERVGDTAVQAGSRVRVQGRAPAGVITSAVFLGVEEDGDEVAQPVDSSLYDPARQPGPLDEPFVDFLRNDGGVVRGQLTLGCLFSAPGPGCSVPHEDVRTVALRLTVAGERGQSGELRVDYVRPTLRAPEVVATDEVRVRFSEPVRHRQGDSPTDWRVVAPDGRELPVLAVRGGGEDDCVYGEGDDTSAGRTGCTRVLTVAGTFAEDVDPADPPTVEYLLALATPVGNAREPYDDFASNNVLAGLRRVQDAIDRIRPPAPRIESVEGTPPPTLGGAVVGADPQVTVVLSGLRPGHVPVLRITPPGAEPVEVSGPPATGSTAELAVTLGRDGTHLLQAVAVDPVAPAVPGRTASERGGGNRSDDPELRSARPDGSPSRASYLLDRAVLAVVSAVGDPEQPVVELLFSKPVTGPDLPTQFSIRLPDGSTLPVLEVTGSGERRTLRTTRPVPKGSVVVYEPSTSATAYRDASGRTLDRFAIEVGGVSLPLVTVPDGPVVTRQRTVSLTGTAEPGAVVEVVLDRDGDGQPSGDPVLATAATGADGRWTASAELPDADGAYDLLVVAVVDGRRSPAARVPRVTLDRVAPQLDVTRPAAGQVLAGGSRQTVSWTFSDANPGLGVVLVSYSVAGGPRVPIARAAGSGGGSVTWTTPDLSSDLVRVHLEGVDAAGNEGTDASEPFVLDGREPAFTARTTDSRTVVVRFTEADVQGTSTALDWAVDGEQASRASQTREDDLIVVTLTTGPGTVLAPDAQPVVSYTPRALSEQYRDRAGQLVRDRDVLALDGILPAPPAVTAPTQQVLTAQATQRVSGRGTVGDSVELVDPQDRRVAGPQRVAADGTWTLDVALPRDGVLDLRARSVDRNGNRSATSVPVVRIEQDGTDPVVAVTEPRDGTRVEPGQRVAVRWTSRDRNLQDGTTLVEVSTDGGGTWTTLAERQPAAGSTTWTVPSTVTPDARLRVSTTDRAGRTGRATAGPLGIGTAPAGSATPSASGTPSSSPSASPSSSLPPLPPLQVAVPDGSIVPGQRATVSVSGAPGTRVELRAYSRPSTTYVTARSATLDSRGRFVWSINPGTNTRLFVRDVDGRQADSRSAVVTVRTAMSLTVVRNGRRDYTFQGRILPRRADQLITLYRVESDGRRIITAQLRTDDSGTYRLRRVFTGSGRFGFVTRTGANLTNMAGESNDGRARPTDIF